MKRPIRRPRDQMLLWRVLLLVVFVPIALMGFISSPGEKHQSNEAALNIEALMKRVMQLNKQKEHQKAIDLLLQVVDKQKEDSILRTLLVQTFDLFLEEEIRQGQQNIQANRSDKFAYIRVAGALELLGDNVRAMEMLLNGILYKPNAPELWMKIARLELKAHRDKEALDVFKEVIRLDKKNSDAYNNAAYLLTKAENCDVEDLKEAQSFANSARSLDPKNPEYLDTLAEVHFRQGNPKMAQTLIEEAIKLAPEKDAFKNQLKRFSNDTSLMPK